MRANQPPLISKGLGSGLLLSTVLGTAVAFVCCYCLACGPVWYHENYLLSCFTFAPHLSLLDITLGLDYQESKLDGLIPFPWSCSDLLHCGPAAWLHVARGDLFRCSFCTVSGHRGEELAGEHSRLAATSFLDSNHTCLVFSNL